MSEIPVGAGRPAQMTTEADLLAPPLVDAAGSTETPSEADVLAPVYAFPRLELVRGRGAHVYDRQGNEYLDFVGGIGVNALGHAPAGLARVVSRQMRQLVHCSNIFGNAPAFEFARALTAATGYERVFFCNSGAEAVEAALKFARARAAGQARPGREIVAFSGAFHGRTAFALSATWNAAYREPFLPLVPGVRFGAFNEIETLPTLIGDHTAAVIVEPVQGESGAIPATREFLAALRARTTAAGATLIFDEIQCGMGRCGRLLAAENFGVTADMTVLSKALGGGLPFAAVLLTGEAAGALKPGMHGSTFGGGPVAAGAAAFVLDRINRPAFFEQVRRRGEQLGRRLHRLVAKHDSLVEARGLGLLRAVELAADAPFTAPDLVRAAARERLLLVRGGERAVRFLPPLNVTPRQIDTALARFEAALVNSPSMKGKEG